ncbi:zinc ribbon domain-containing protein [Streptomyces sp. NPDC001617]
MHCPNCGARIAPQDAFCGECGRRITPETTTAPHARQRAGTLARPRGGNQCVGVVRYWQRLLLPAC